MAIIDIKLQNVIATLDINSILRNLVPMPDPEPPEPEEKKEN